MSNEISMFSGDATLSPGIQDLVVQCTELMKLSIVQGLAAEEGSNLFAGLNGGRPDNKIGRIVANRLRSLPIDGKRNRPDYKTALPIQQLYDADVRSISRKHNVNLFSSKTPLQQINKAQFKFIERDLFDKTRLNSLHDSLFSVRSEAIVRTPIASNANAIRSLSARNLSINPAILRMIIEASSLGGVVTTAPPIVANRGLKFRVNKVKCIDETNPEWPGDDEIAMGAVAIGDDGTTKKINEFRVRSDFDDGESKTYSPPRVLHNFSLDGISYPGDFSVVVALAEKDNGGLSGFINELWDAIKDNVDEIVLAVGAAAGAAVGTAIGGGLGTAVGGPLGAILGAVIGAILGALVNWLINALKDDIFEPQAAAIRLPTASSLFENEATISPTMSLNFRDHGGYYRVYYSWEIVR